MSILRPENLLSAMRQPGAGRLAKVTALLQHVLPGAGAGPGDGPSGSAIPAALRGFLDRVIGHPDAPASPAETTERDAADGRFLTKTFTNEAGSRPYRLYVPSRLEGAVPLIVMLHGCNQSPDDFAAGTRMNAAADQHGFLVAYPGQTKAANSSKCWNWFSADDQRRDHGEPSLIAGITREVMQHYPIDPRRVYVAGLSAGGAAAAIMGASYPDLYAAICVHSGLACGAARDLPSAFAAMRQGSGGQAHHGPGATGVGRRLVPAIVFHGDRDSTVHPRNADEVIAQSARDTKMQTIAQEGRVPGGHAYTCTLFENREGKTVLEQWVIHGAGHAWAGGSPAGSYTDPQGPDATQEMVRFFLEHPRTA